MFVERHERIFLSVLWAALRHSLRGPTPHLSRDMLSEERVRAATRACAYSHSETETHAAGEDLKALGDGLVSSPNDAGWAMHAKML